MRRQIEDKLLSDTENAKTARAMLVTEIRVVTDLNIDNAVKILEIQYLVRQFFESREQETFQ